MTIKEEIKELEAQLKEECNKLTRNDYTDLEESWEEHLDFEIWSEGYDKYGWDRGEVLYLDQVIESVFDKNRELTDEEKLEILKWAVLPDTVKASCWDW